MQEPPHEVDPRVCGGATVASPPALTAGGRSPRLRGSHRSGGLRRQRNGSIPASAGEPHCALRGTRAARVDPRVCGGAVWGSDLHPPPKGRSPRLRGSRYVLCMDTKPTRSIPASAGEPSRGVETTIQSWVDPRVCGGAEAERRRRHRPRGRSPRLRGSLGQLGVYIPQWRSIPASAGEPAQANNAVTLTAVDPRVCGGAPTKSGIRVRFRGRSPRLRGSPGRSARVVFPGGSIPASAGEPSLRLARGRQPRVDPRVCGGARICRARRCNERGRSPRLRGSPYQ